uniref:von Willebrand factor C domain-containing protein 2-like isoform X1 n=1 Tax=Myxine glutinosa TaxID=7769 RepID=UPI00358F67A0
MEAAHGALSLLIVVFLVSVTYTFPTKTDSTSEPGSPTADYILEDYRGKGCLDETGFVYKLGEEFSPSQSSCPCVCTEDGPVCPNPECPRFSTARCARVEHNGCCPECKEEHRMCEHGGVTYALLEEFQTSQCERCRCESNGEVACVVADCPIPECVNPVYEPEQCCPICQHGANCFANTRIIPAGKKVRVDECTVCECPTQENWTQTDSQAECYNYGC